MSNSELNESRNPHNENAQSFHNTQENPHHANDMELDKKETVTPGPVLIADTDLVCIDVIDNSKELCNETNEDVDAGMSPNMGEFKVHIISLPARQRSSIREFYDNMVDYGKQQRLARQNRNQDQPALLELTAALQGTAMSHDRQYIAFLKVLQDNVQNNLI